ncbi:hypothetical protein EUTSA_v10027354mg, partial [Eutrema salsugineum]
MERESETRRYSNLSFRWWKDAQDSMSSKLVEKREILYTATTGSSYGGPMKLNNNIFNSDILFDLRRKGDALQNGETGEASVSSRDFALKFVLGYVTKLQIIVTMEGLLYSRNIVGNCCIYASVSCTLYHLKNRRHYDDKNTERGVKSFSAGGVDRGDVYPVQLKLSVLEETNSLADNSVECFSRACKIFSLDSEQ